MSHAAISGLIRPSYPREAKSEGATGNTYSYRGLTATLVANKPEVGEVWADSRNISFVEYFELSDASGLSDMIVTTQTTSTISSLGTPAVEETLYELDWRPVAKPLEVHPDFVSGGTYAIDQTARKHIIGWRAELDPDLRSQRQYKQLDSDGVPSGTITTISGVALTFIRFLEVGVEEYIDYMPVWRKRSIYRGSVAPGTSSIGIKTSTPSGTGYPTGYEWVKSRDRAERIWTKTRWIRDEEWEGAIKVYADKVDVYVPA